MCVCLRLTAVRGGQVFSCCRFLRADTGVNTQQMMSQPRRGGQTTHKVQLSFRTDLLNIKAICCVTGYKAGCLRSPGARCHSDLGDLDLGDPQFPIRLCVYSCLSRMAHFFELVYVGTSPLRPVQIRMLPVRLEQSSHNAVTHCCNRITVAVSCISVRLIMRSLPLAGKKHTTFPL